MKFGYAAEIAEGQVDPTVEPYRYMPLIAPDHIESRSGRLLSIETAEEQHALSGKYLCQRGDVIYSKIRPALMKACLAPAEGLCSADMYPLRPVSALLSDRFLLFILLSDHFTDFAVLQSQRVAMPKINREALRSFLLLIPPLSEQHAIADYLDTETARIDALIKEAEETITLMQEHRSALISACVTGKVKVPGVADPAAQEQAV